MKDSVSRTLLRQAAIKKGYTVSTPGDDEYFLEVTHPSGNTVYFRGTLSNRNSAIGSLIARRKDLTLAFVEKHFTHVPAYTLYDQQTADDFLDSHQTIVVKPIDGAQSRGVTTGITSPQQLTEAVELAKLHSFRGQIVLQKQISGKLYRLLVINGKLEAAALREAATVIGDGASTARQLIEQLNSDPRRGDDTDSPLKFISLEAAKDYVGAAKLDEVLAQNEHLRVSPLDSVSAGGQAIDVTDEVHPKHAELAEKLTAELNLYTCGFDIMCDDITAEPDPDYWPLLEINSGPGLKIHHFPTGGGQPRDVATIIIDHLFDAIAK